jgi:hypothetical protein
LGTPAIKEGAVKQQSFPFGSDELLGIKSWQHGERNFLFTFYS